jgi:hypothetical protein
LHRVCAGVVAEDDVPLDDAEDEGEGDEVDEHFSHQQGGRAGQLFPDRRYVGEDGEDDRNAVGDPHAVVGDVLVVHEQTVEGQVPQGEEDGEQRHEGHPIHRNHEVRVLIIGQFLML